MLECDDLEGRNTDTSIEKLSLAYQYRSACRVGLWYRVRRPYPCFACSSARHGPRAVLYEKGVTLCNGD